MDDQQILGVPAPRIRREVEAARDDRGLIDHDNVVVGDLRLAIDERR